MTVMVQLMKIQLTVVVKSHVPEEAVSAGMMIMITMLMMLVEELTAMIPMLLSIQESMILATALTTTVMVQLMKMPTVPLTVEEQLKPIVKMEMRFGRYGIGVPDHTALVHQDAAATAGTMTAAMILNTITTAIPATVTMLRHVEAVALAREIVTVTATVIAA